MIDTLMMAYTVETVSVEKVMACIRQYSSSNPEVETPYDTEDAVTTWINKVGDGEKTKMVWILLEEVKNSFVSPVSALLPELNT